MISGSWPPQACGVGDYTEVLSRELEKHGVSVARFVSGGFSNLYSSEIVNEIERTDCDVVHIQYPTAGYRRSLTPSALARSIRSKPVVVTLHEYSVFRWYRRAWFSPFARHCAARVFTTDDERELFERRFPARNGLDLTIEIASNIPVSPSVERQPGRVCYFGLIAPRKGIEEFLALCADAGSVASELKFELIGAIPERYRVYAGEILKHAAACGVQISLHLPDDAVAERLAGATFAYLPFPDGASAKRGTLAAAIVNGLIVVTRHSGITPEWMRSTTLDAKSPRDALGAIVLMQSDSRLRSEIRNRIAHAANRFRWDAIAQRHVELYRQLLNIEADKGRDVAAAPSVAATPYESRLAS